MSTLGSIQQQIADTLSANPFFAHIPVLTEKMQDIENEMERALGPVTAVGGKSGGFVVVVTPTANANFGNVFGPFFDEINVGVQVTVNVPVAEDPNCGIGVTALDIMEAVCSTLDLTFPANGNGPLTPGKPTIQLLSNEPGNVTYLGRFTCMGGLRVTAPQAATPAISGAGTYTLTCATPGAAVFYTLDGSNPGPRNGALYTAPITPGAGLTLKARAWLAGYLTSSTLSATT